MEIIEVPIEKLKSSRNNLRINLKKNDFMFKCLLASVLTFGLQFPLLINEGYEVISGRQLFKVLKILNYKTVPCIITTVPREKEPDLIISLNKIRGEWYILGLKKYFKEHKYTPDKLKALGFDGLEIDCLMSLDKFPSLKREEIKDKQLKIF